MLFLGSSIIVRKNLISCPTQTKSIHNACAESPATAPSQHFSRSLRENFSLQVSQNMKKKYGRCCNIMQITMRKSTIPSQYRPTHCFQRKLRSQKPKSVLWFHHFDSTFLPSSSLGKHLFFCKMRGSKPFDSPINFIDMEHCAYIFFFYLHSYVTKAKSAFNFPDLKIVLPSLIKLKSNCWFRKLHIAIYISCPM